MHSSLLSLPRPRCVYIYFIHGYTHIINFFLVSKNNALHNVISYFFTVEFIPSLFVHAIDIEINHGITKEAIIILYNYNWLFLFFKFHRYFTFNSHNFRKMILNYWYINSYQWLVFFTFFYYNILCLIYIIKIYKNLCTVYT